MTISWEYLYSTSLWKATHCKYCLLKNPLNVVRMLTMQWMCRAQLQWSGGTGLFNFMAEEGQIVWVIIRMFMVPPWRTLSMFSACSIPINAGSTNAVRNFQVWCILAALLRMIWKAQQYRTRRRCVNRFLTLSFPVTTVSSHTSDLPFIQAIFRSVGLYPLCFGPLDLSRALIYVSVSGSMVFLTS